MPSHFDRFRLLNNGSRLKNEGDKPVYVRAFEEETPIVVPPGAELVVPKTPEGDTIIEVPSE